MTKTIQFASDFAPIEVERKRGLTSGETFYHIIYKGELIGSIARWEDDPKAWIFRNRHGNEIENHILGTHYGDSFRNAACGLFNYWWCEMEGSKLGK